MSVLDFGDHPGIISGTRIVHDGKGREVIELQFLPDASPADATTVPLNFFDGAKAITARQLAALGYKGRLQAIADGNSALNGTRCILEVKQGAPRNNGGFFHNYNIKPARVAVVQIADDFDFASVGEKKDGDGAPAGW